MWQGATSRIFAGVSSWDERISAVGFLKVPYHVEPQFLKSVSRAWNISVYISTRYVNRSLSFLFKCPLCHRVKEFAVSVPLFHLPVSDLCKLAEVHIVSFNINQTTCRIEGKKISLPAFLLWDSRFRYGFSFSSFNIQMQYFLAFGHEFSALCRVQK